MAEENYDEPLSITNSFGVPSFDPDFWQKDLANAVKYAKTGKRLLAVFRVRLPVKMKKSILMILLWPHGLLRKQALKFWK